MRLKSFGNVFPCPLPRAPPLMIVATRPFSKAFRKQFPTAKIISYDGDDDGKLPFVRSLVGAFCAASRHLIIYRYHMISSSITNMMTYESTEY